MVTAISDSDKQFERMCNLTVLDGTDSQGRVESQRLQRDALRLAGAALPP